MRRRHGRADSSSLQFQFVRRLQYLELVQCLFRIQFIVQLEFLIQFEVVLQQLELRVVEVEQQLERPALVSTTPRLIEMPRDQPGKCLGVDRPGHVAVAPGRPRLLFELRAGRGVAP